LFIVAFLLGSLPAAFFRLLHLPLLLSVLFFVLACILCISSRVRFRCLSNLFGIGATTTKSWRRRRRHRFLYFPQSLCLFIFNSHIFANSTFSYSPIIDVKGRSCAPPAQFHIAFGIIAAVRYHSVPV